MKKGSNTADRGINRVATYVAHPEAENYNKYLLTLLAQKRQLQAECVKQLSSPSVGHEAVQGLLQSTASNLAIDKERRQLQSHLVSQLPVKSAQNQRDSAQQLQQAVETAGDPLQGCNEASILCQHFCSQQASLAVQRRELGRHMAAIRATHFAHVVGDSLPLDLAAGSGQYRAALSRSRATCQLEQVPAKTMGASEGGCGCMNVLRVAGQVMSAIHAGEVDAAARAARLQQAGTGSGGATAAQTAVQDSDWEVATRYVQSVGPACRLASRLQDRLEMLPFSHHHRYPIYEQASGAALERDARMSAAGLRVPPTVIKHASKAEQQLISLLQQFPNHDSLGSQASSQAAPATEHPVAAMVEEEEEDLGSRSQQLYHVRNLLPRLLHAYALRWPGASTPIDLNQPQ